MSQTCNGQRAHTEQYFIEPANPVLSILLAIDSWFLILDELIPATFFNLIFSLIVDARG